jgi:outer membrane protein assembly factor BamB
VRLFLCVSITLSLAFAAEWTQWRGPARTGFSSDFVAPKVWPKQFQKKWTTPVGPGYSSPVVSTTGIFVFSRLGEAEMIECIDRTTGKQRWKASYPAPFQPNQYALSMGKGPFSTPALAGSLVITLGVNGVLSAWQTSTGALAWRKDFSRRVDNRNMYTGTAMSPLIENGMLIVHIGDDRGGSLLALDPQSGHQKWSWDGDGPSYSSPIAVTIGSTRQIIALTLKHAVGLNAATGALLWQLAFPDQYNENIITPGASGNRIFFSGVRRGTLAVDIAQSGTRWGAKIAWENPESTLYMSSPVLDGNWLYGVTQKRKGSLFCLDARTGKLQWSTPGREGTNVSLAAAGDLLFTLNDTGDLKVLRRSPASYQSIAGYKVSDETTWPQPVLLGSTILIRDAKSLTLWSAE